MAELSEEELRDLKERVDAAMCETHSFRDGRHISRMESRISLLDWNALRAHISALTRARDEARAQALEEAARLVEEHRRDGPETVAAIGLKQKLAAALRSLAEEQP